MLDIYLIIWGALLSIELFTGYIIVDTMGSSVEAFFPLLMMLIGLVFLFLTNTIRKENEKADKVFYQGYESMVLTGSYAVILMICLCVIVGLYDNTSMTSPVLMSTWLLPMLNYSMYNATIIFTKKTFRMGNKKIDYKDVCSIKIIDDKKNKKRIFVNCKKNSYYYVGKENIIKEIQKNLITKNKHIKIVDK